MANISRIKGGDLELKEKVVSINRVVKTTKGGRAFSFSALVVVGDGNGVVGQGLGKAKEVQEAILKGIDDAKKNLIRVPVMHGTIPHEQWSKEGAAKVLIKPAAHGTGVIAGGSMRAVLEAAGITEVLAKSLCSAHSLNSERDGWGERGDSGVTGVQTCALPICCTWYRCYCRRQHACGSGSGGYY